MEREKVVYTPSQIKTLAAYCFKEFFNEESAGQKNPLTSNYVLEKGKYIWKEKK